LFDGDLNALKIAINRLGCVFRLKEMEVTHMSEMGAVRQQFSDVMVEQLALQHNYQASDDE